VIAVDSNILVYAHRRDSAWHSAASEAMRRVSESPSSWLLPWPCIHEFLSTVTHRRIYVPASTVDEAALQVELWFQSPNVVVGGESPQHWETVLELIRKGKAIGPLVHDARIAAICLNHGVNELWSADRDFSRFPGLKVVNPLVSA